MADSHRERELIAEAVSGDTGALQALLYLHMDKLLAYIEPRIPAKLRRDLNAEDVRQEALLAAYRDFAQYQPREGVAFFPWLKKIADRRLLDAIRRHGRKEGKVDWLPAGPQPGASSMADLIALVAGETSTPSSRFSRKEAEQALQVALATLPEKQRKAVTLHHLQQMPVQEVAMEMKMTEGQVRGLLHRGRKKLRDALGRSSLYLSRK